MSLLPKSRVKMRGIITTLSIANWTKAITGIKVIETWGIRDRCCFRWLLVNEPVKGFSCPMSPYKVIRLRNPGNSCFSEPEILEFEIHFSAQGIPNSASDWNLESKFHWQGICNSLLGIRNPQCGIQNPGLSCISLQGAISVVILNSSERNSKVMKKTDRFYREKNGTQVMIRTWLLRN